MAYLRHLLNGNVVTIYEIAELTTLGRNLSCDIAIDDPTVSGEHAQIRFADDQCSIRDLDSTNGVMVQGSKQKDATLASGQTFSIGSHEFEFLTEIPNDLDKTLKIKKSWIPGVYFTE